MSDFSGQNVIVTGASSGFGEAIALKFAAAGAHVAMIARREEVLRALAQRIESDGGRALVYPCDVGDEAQIRATVEKIDAELGPIHILVNNAGTNVVNRSIDATTIEDWRVVADVNLVSAYLFTNLLMPQMKARAPAPSSTSAHAPPTSPACSPASPTAAPSSACTPSTASPTRRATPTACAPASSTPASPPPPPRPPARPAPPGSPQAHDAIGRHRRHSPLRRRPPLRANAERIDLYPTNTEVG